MKLVRLMLAVSVISAATAASGAYATGELDAVLGKALFERDWIPAPASTDSADGLGPLFSARSCAGCHGGEARSARFTEAQEGKIAARGLVVRFGDAEGRPDPVYGHLLQNQALEGMQSEGRIVVSADAADGYDLALHLARGPLDAATRQSVRLAPPLPGRALLERADADAVRALADPGDRDGDGISGRARIIERGGETVLGRYGWKAGNADLAEQVSDAFALDLGLSNSRRPLPHGDCTEREPDCLGGPSGGSARMEGHEISDEMISLVAAFVQSLRPPVRKPEESGAKLFAAAGCAACHQPRLPGSNGESIAAYTDLLLHDMGSALDDGVGERGVASAEWRTAPLMAMSVGKGRRYLHDGRAATVDAAIRAHGGEADKARQSFEALSAGEQATLVAFVESL
jgi:CxxC motif-containing protein (DUF1111 family)